MTNWSIVPSGVVAVLQDVNVPAEALGTALGGLESAMTGAVTATQSAAIADAVQTYFTTEEGPRIEGINARIGAAASGVVSATEAYVAGDLDMAANAQTASIAAVYPPALPHGLVM
jgi:hypothetical protein